MRRIELFLDPDLVAEAMRLAGERTPSGAVRRALEELIVRRKEQRLGELRGAGLTDATPARAPRRPPGS